MDWLKLAFHLFAFVTMFSTTLYHFTMINIGTAGMGGKLKFLTVWNMLFQTIYFGFTLIVDLLEKKSNPAFSNQRGTLERWRDGLHACVVFPTTVFVFVSFWTLYAIDRELVFPKAIDPYFPSWLNHMVHTTILPYILIDKLVSHHHYPSRLSGFLGCASVSALYLVWILIIAFVDDFWVYPVLRVLTVEKRTAFLAVCILCFGCVYFVGDIMTNSVWGKSQSQGQRSSSQSRNKTKKSRKTK